jgi:uncharacterized pyridoxal phosphate-containing UPF0001 family protein
MSGGASIAQNARAVLDRAAAAARRAGRDPAEVRLVAVTKAVPAGRILEAIDAGLRVFGENYVQEAARKIALVQAGAPARRSRAQARADSDRAGAEKDRGDR